MIRVSYPRLPVAGHSIFGLHCRVLPLSLSPWTREGQVTARVSYPSLGEGYAECFLGRQDRGLLFFPDHMSLGWPLPRFPILWVGSRTMVKGGASE